jgi:CO dehydrogenase maturation factor
MSYNIAVAGKGGTGKTSLAAVIIRYLKSKGAGPVLAVDADPNANLGESLGIAPASTVGRILGEFQRDKIDIPAGLTKEAYLERRLNEALTESAGLDLLTMGRGEGPDCYCYPNTVLRKFMDSLAGGYAYTVMDNEAGLEHLSRGTTQDIDDLLIVSDATVKGVRTVARVKELVGELGLAVRRQSVVINRVAGGLDPLVKDELGRLGLTPAAVLPQDEMVFKFDLQVRPLLSLPDSSPLVQAVGKLLDGLLAGR